MHKYYMISFILENITHYKLLTEIEYNRYLNNCDFNLLYSIESKVKFTNKHINTLEMIISEKY